jgi:hypothetical protein
MPVVDWVINFGLKTASGESRRGVRRLDARGGPTMFARIRIMRALNPHEAREFNRSREDPYWGRRKLARDR